MKAAYPIPLNVSVQTKARAHITGTAQVRLDLSTLTTRTLNRLVRAIETDMCEFSYRSVVGGLYRMISGAHGFHTSWVHHSRRSFNLALPHDGLDKSQLLEVMDHMRAVILLAADAKEQDAIKRWYGSTNFVKVRNDRSGAVLYCYSPAEKVNMQLLIDMAAPLRTNMRNPAVVNVIVESIKKRSVLQWAQPLSFQ